MQVFHRGALYMKGCMDKRSLDDHTVKLNCLAGVITEWRASTCLVFPAEECVANCKDALSIFQTKPKTT